MKLTVIAFCALFALSGCASMTDEEKAQVARALIGSAQAGWCSTKANQYSPQCFQGPQVMVHHRYY